MKRLLSLALLAVLPLTVHAKPKSEQSKLAGTYKGETRAKDETRAQSQDGTYAIRHHTMALDLGKDGTAKALGEFALRGQLRPWRPRTADDLATQFFGNEPPGGISAGRPAPRRRIWLPG